MEDNQFEQGFEQNVEQDNTPDIADNAATDSLNATEQLSTFKEKMDAAVERLTTAHTTMDEANTSYDAQREERNRVVAEAEAAADKRINAVRDEENEKVAQVKAAADEDLDTAGEVADEATLDYKAAFDEVVKSEVLSRSQLSALGFSKVTRRRVSRKKK